MRTGKKWLIVLACACLACAKDEPAPGAMHAPTSPAYLGETDDGSADVRAEIAMFDATPALRPGRNVIEGSLANLIATATAATKLEVIVTFDPGVTSATAVASALRGAGAGVIGFRNLPMVFAIASPAAVSQVAAMNGIVSVFPNRQLKYFLHESIATIGADKAHFLGWRGNGIGAAILDSGLDGLYSPDLAYPSHTVANVKFLASVKDLVTYEPGDPVAPGGELFVEQMATSETSSGHGTHVAGIVGGTGAASAARWYTGVAPGANLIGVGTGDVLFVFWALAGFDWLIDHRVQYNIKVVNNSWGSSGEFNPNDPINIATRIVHDAGITVVFAAGNCGRGGDVDCPAAGETQLNPYSVAPWTISVAATCKRGVQDPTNSVSQCVDPVSGREPVLANFSSVGVPNTIYAPDIGAPGVRIVSTRSAFGTTLNALDASGDARTCAIAVQNVPYYTCASGTSMAAPHITGVVALMQGAAGGRLTPDQVLGLLKKTATTLPGYADWEVGVGLVNALAATQRAAKK